MKLAAIAICALVAVSFADEFSTTLDETNFLQEHVTLEAGTKTHAKVAAKDTARTQAMAMARAQLHKVITKLGKRHPEMLGEAAAVEDFAKEPAAAGKLAGGYTKLKKVLKKVDDLENELSLEGRTARKGRELKEKSCNHNARRNGKAIADSQQSLKDKRAIMDGYAGDIEDIRRQIAASLKSEGGSDSKSYQTQMNSQLKDVKKAYSEYWVNTDDRAQVRNILMQALWLVCTGFRSFRHHAYCETLRKQPDYAEPAKPQGALTGRDGGAKYRLNSGMTNKFSKTMKSVWDQQKIADANAVNRADGDIDMEKGFVNNRAPWGVDPAPQAAEMTNKQLASRLSFLLETSTAPTRVASPIAGFISALQEGVTDKEGASKGLVDMLVNMDREEGEAQAKEDAEWYKMVVSARKSTNDFAGAQEDLADAQNKWTAEIRQLEEKMNYIKMSVVDYEKAEMKIGKAMKQELNQCELTYIEFDAILEVVAEELVNVQRLNSLMRFLALDQTPTCTSSSGKACTDAEQGSCTWMTRGGSHKGGANKDGTFCACEYGFYGKNCELRTCPGFGRIRYKAGQDGVCMNGGRCDTSTGTCKQAWCKFRRYHGPKNKCELIRCPKGARAGVPVYMTAKDPAKIACSGQSNGLCNLKRGKCECTADWWGPHCGWKKCPASNAQGQVIGLFRGTSANACDGRGACNPTGAKRGTCTCSGSHYYGNACQFANCGGGSSDKNQCQGKGKCDAKTGLCFCSKGNFGGSNCKLCRSCHYKTCPASCNTQGSGHCNRIAGYCVCNSRGTYNGSVCKTPCRRDAYEADWSRSMDKWGWSTCKKGWLLTGIAADGRGDALYNLDRGKCEKPCEGNAREVIKLAHCYHENWWKKFDSKGGKFCRRNYFVAGLFRSHCNSLYCLEMAKCCQIKRSLWTKCSWAEISSSFSRGRRMSTVRGSIAFIAGFYRGSSHTLSGFKYFRQCEPIFYGSNFR